MSEFTPPTGERAEKILKASREVIASGQTIGSGAAELPKLKEASGLGDITADERDWAFAQDQPASDAKGDSDSGKDKADAKNTTAPKAKSLPKVHCGVCDRPVDKVDRVTDTGKVYVECHGARQGIAMGKGTLVAFEPPPPPPEPEEEPEAASDPE